MCANCHVVSVKAEFTDLDAIKAACARLGWTFRQNQQTYQWYARGWQDDSPVPRHLFATEDDYQKVVAMGRPERIKTMNGLLGKCTHAISVPGCAYGIGLIERGKQFIPIWDSWGAGGLDKLLGAEGGPLVQAYAVEKTKLQARHLGHTLTEHALEDGTVQLKIMVQE